MARTVQCSPFGVKHHPTKEYPGRHPTIPRFQISRRSEGDGPRSANRPTSNLMPTQAGTLPATSRPLTFFEPASRPATGDAIVSPPTAFSPRRRAAATRLRPTTTKHRDVSGWRASSMSRRNPPFRFTSGRTPWKLARTMNCAGAPLRRRFHQPSFWFRLRCCSFSITTTPSPTT